MQSRLEHARTVPKNEQTKKQTTKKGINGVVTQTRQRIIHVKFDAGGYITT